MILHYERHSIFDLWWICHKAFTGKRPIGTYKREWFYSVPCSFDIETSSFYDNDEKRSIMYVWMLGIDGYVVVGRKWDEFIYCCNYLSDYLSLGNSIYLPIYVHNLSYEFQFIRKRFNWEKVFSIDVRKPNYARTSNGIEFRCSYQLSGYSLAKLGDELQTYNVRKLVGNLDYDLIRTSETPLMDDEWDYCINDVLVVMAYIQECIDNEGDITKIPLTKTGYVRRYVKQETMGTSKHRNGKYRTLIKSLTLEPYEYILLNRAFQGGFTHASSLYSGITVNNVSSYDFTSSYPTVMLCEQFPMSCAECIDNINEDDFNESLDLFCCLFTVSFINIRATTYFENYISKSRCTIISPNSEINNGRVVDSEYLTMTMTETDYKIINNMYEWDDMTITDFRRYRKQYLPSKFINGILTLYEAKTQLKGIKGKEVEYMQAKANLNSLYGMIVTNICRDEIEYGDDWKPPIKCDIETAIGKYNNSSSRFLFYPWGVWVTAYARRNLFTGILECSSDYVYSDTDSIKITNAETHKDYIEGYNKAITNKIRNAMNFIGLEFERTCPETKEGIKKPLGVWDYEGTYDRFKTLGAKRYLTEKKGKYELTVSGLNKRIAIDYLQSRYDDVFDAFDDKLYIPKGKTGKQIHTYIDDRMIGNVTDYMGIKSSYDEYSGIHLEAADYSLTIGREYADFLYNVRYVRS